MLDVFKGSVVTLICLVGMLLQLSVGIGRTPEQNIFVVGTVIMGSFGLGAAFGSIAGNLRSDRIITLFAVELAIVSVMLMLTTVSADDLEWHVRVFETYPWLVIGSVVLAWWTRRPEPPTVPTMRVRSSRLVMRRLTAVEISTLVALACAIVIALGTEVGIRPYDIFDGDQSPTDRPTMLRRLGLFCTMALPLGVALGSVAGRLTRLRFLLLPLIGFVGCGYFWCLAVGTIDRIEFAIWSPFAIVVALVAIVRFARPPRAAV